MKAVRETEKAIAVKAICYVVYAPASGFVSSLVRDREFETLVWIPKSQLINGNPSNWILGKKKEALREEQEMRVPYLVRMDVTFVDADNKEVKGEMSEYDKQREARKEEAYKRGCERHDALVEEAKALGIKGVRKNLRTETLEDMIAQAKASKEVKEEVEMAVENNEISEVKVEKVEVVAEEESVAEMAENNAEIKVTDATQLSAGNIVRHIKFGVGKVLSLTKDVADIAFDEVEKRLLVKYAKLIKIA